jgi:hypothetical protein
MYLACYSDVMRRSHVGSDFDDFLKQDGLLADAKPVRSSALWLGNSNRK